MENASPKDGAIGMKELLRLNLSKVTSGGKQALKFDSLPLAWSSRRAPKLGIANEHQPGRNFLRAKSF